MPSNPGRALKLALLWAARACGLFALSRRLTRRGLRILCYHGIWLGPGHFADYLFMSADKFRRRMTWLARSGYPVVSLDHAVRGLASDSLPDGATVITIDDGWLGTYRHMAPVLRDLRLPATLYVSTYYVQRQLPVFNVALQYLLAKAPRRHVELTSKDASSKVIFDLDVPAQKEEALDRITTLASAMNGERAFDYLTRLSDELGLDMSHWIEQRVFHLMTGEELAIAHSQGLDIQLHTHRHRLEVDQVHALSGELADNRTHLQNWVSTRLNHFCYPSGVWSEACWPALRSAGIESATTTEQGLNYAGDNPLCLKRLLDGESVHDLEFEAEMSGLFELKRRLIHSLRSRKAPAAQAA